MQITINLTNEQLLAISSSVDNIDVSAHADQLVSHLLTEKGEQQELAAYRASVEAFKEQWIKDNRNSYLTTNKDDPSSYSYVEYKVKAFKTLRSRVIMEVGSLAKEQITEIIKAEADKISAAALESVRTSAGTLIANLVASTVIKSFSDYQNQGSMLNQLVTVINEGR